MTFRLLYGSEYLCIILSFVNIQHSKFVYIIKSPTVLGNKWKHKNSGSKLSLNVLHLNIKYVAQI